MLSEGPDSCYTRMTAACDAFAANARAGLKPEAVEARGIALELDPLEDVLPDIEQGRVHDSDHEKGERDRIG